MSLGNRIRRLRLARGWTLERLSEASGVEVGTLSALEIRNSGRSKYSPQIAAAFGITTDELFGAAPLVASELPAPPYAAQLLEAFEGLLPEEQEAALADITMRARDNRQKWEAMKKKFGLPDPMPDAEVGKHISPRPAQREIPIEPIKPHSKKGRAAR